MIETTGETLLARQSELSDFLDPRAGVGTKPAFPLAIVVRVTRHLAIWAAILIPTAMEMARGWRPLLDDATISARSYEVLSLHSPLPGQFSQASFSHGSTSASHLIFSPGPLQYWLLALLVHLDPIQGALWAAALWSGAILAGHRGRVVASRLGWLRWRRTCRYRLGLDDAPSLRAPGVESLLWSHLLRGHRGLCLCRRDRLTWLVASARSDGVSRLSDPFDLLRSLGCARAGCTGAGSSPKRTTRASSLASGGCRRWCYLLDGSRDSRTHGASRQLDALGC